LEPVLSLTTESRRGELLQPSSVAAPSPVLVERSEGVIKRTAPSPAPPAVAPSTQTQVEEGAQPLPTAESDLGNITDSDSIHEVPDDPVTEEMAQQDILGTENSEPDYEEQDEPEDEEAQLERLVNETRPMESLESPESPEALESRESLESREEDSISPVDEMGSIWDESRNRASAGADGSIAAAESLEGDEDITWFELFLPWNWWK
jgi:hypothetical protein